MRNILVFPDGSRQDFMYPPNRELSIGDDLQAQMKDDSLVALKISDILVQEKEIHYLLSY